MEGVSHGVCCGGGMEVAEEAGVLGRAVVGIELVEAEEVGRGPQRFGVAIEGDGVGELRTTSAREAGPVGILMPLGVVVPELLCD